MFKNGCGGGGKVGSVRNTCTDGNITARRLSHRRRDQMLSARVRACSSIHAVQQQRRRRRSTQTRIGSDAFCRGSTRNVCPSTCGYLNVGDRQETLGATSTFYKPITVSHRHLFKSVKQLCTVLRYETHKLMLGKRISKPKLNRSRNRNKNTGFNRAKHVHRTRTNIMFCFSGRNCIE